MIVFDLRCARDHVFEAWFASSAAWEDQRAAGQVACPICGDGYVTKAVMAPNVAAKGNRQSASATAAPSTDAPSPASIKAALGRLAQAQAQALKNSTWVGSAFASTARAMHAGDQPERPIHGQASLAEAKALADEGVPVAPLPLPVVPPETRN